MSALLLTCLGFGCDAARPSSSVDASFIRGPSDPDITRLVAADFDIDSSGALHLITYVAHGRPGAPEGFRLYYQKGSECQGSTRWSQAVQLIPALGYGARILTGSNSVHVVSGSRLSHMSSHDRGQTWAHLSDLIDTPTRAWDAVAIKDTLLIAYLADSPTASGESLASSSALHLLRWTPDGETSDLVLARFPVRVVFPLSPRLRLANDAVHLVCCVPAEARDWSSGMGTALRSRGLVGQLLYGVSLDFGRSCTPLVSIPLENQEIIDGFGPIGALGSRVPDVDLAPMPSGVEVVATTSCVVRFHSDDGRSWTGPDTLDRHTVPEPSGVGRPTVQLLTAGGSAVLFWISERYQRSQSPGVFGEKQWHNNDVVAATIPAGSSVDELGAHALRLTADQSYASCLRCRPEGTGVRCVWIGYPRVREELPSHYDPQHNLFTARVDALAPVK